MKYQAVGFDFNGVIYHNGQIDQDILRLVESLKNKGYKTGILSNFSLSGKQQIIDSGVAEYFDEILVSGEVDAIKPEPQIFYELTSRLGVKASALIFIDDSDYNLSTANVVGFTPVLFKDYQLLKADLKKLGVNAE